MSDAILLTGGTGFLGMELIARLLDARRRPGHRARRSARATRRRRAGARRGAARRASTTKPPAAAERLRAVPADLTAPGLGLSDADRASLAARASTRVVHCAASISFTLPLEEARAINVDGTRRMLDLAASCRALERFVHVSTAYVRGPRAGRFAEDDLGGGQRSATPTSRPSSRPRLVAATERPADRRRAPEHRRGRVRQRLDARRSTSSTGRCRRSRAGCSPRCRPTPTGSSTWCPSTTSPT